MHITDNFTLEEMLRSSVADRQRINNYLPPHTVIINLTKLCIYVLQPLRDHFKEPVHISSGYRCQELNEAVHGVHNSQHIQGQAADIYLYGDTAKEMQYFNYIKKHIPYDQLILEGNERSSWIHVSFVSLKQNRKQSWMQLQKTSGV